MCKRVCYHVIYVSVVIHAYALAFVWKSENSFRELFLFTMASANQTHVVRFAQQVLRPMAPSLRPHTNAKHGKYN